MNVKDGVLEASEMIEGSERNVVFAPPFKYNYADVHNHPSANPPSPGDP